MGMMITPLVYCFSNLAARWISRGASASLRCTGAIPGYCCNWHGMQPGIHTGICEGSLVI